MDLDYALQKTLGIAKVTDIIVKSRQAIVDYNYSLIQYAAEVPEMDRGIHGAKSVLCAYSGCLDSLLEEVLTLPEVKEAFILTKESSQNTHAKEIIEKIYRNIPDFDVYLNNNPSSF